MSRYKARQWDESDGIDHMIGIWGVFNEHNDTLFGDRMPRDKLEAEQCARAANIAYEEAKDAIKDRLRDLKNTAEHLLWKL